MNQTIRFFSLTAVLAIAAPSFAMDKARCADAVEKYMKAREKLCDDKFAKKEPLQVGKCKEMLAGEKPKMLKQCADTGKIKYEK